MSQHSRGRLGFTPPAQPAARAGLGPGIDSEPTAGVSDTTAAPEVLFDGDLEVGERSRAPLDAAFASLLDNLVVRAEGQLVHRAVVAPVDRVESGRRVAAGLAREARGRGLRTAVARMEAASGGWVLDLDRATRSSHGGKPPLADVARGLRPLALDLRGEAGRAELDSWLDLAASGFDLIVVEGAPLTTSVDAALLARCCDGLLLVAQEAVTTKEALRGAADRARAAGCHVFGVVVDDSYERVPKWLRKLSAALRGQTQHA